MPNGDYLTIQRKLCNFNQAEIAKQINYARQTLSAWETNRLVAPEEALIRLAEIYHIDKEEFFKGYYGEGTEIITLEQNEDCIEPTEIAVTTEHKKRRLHPLFKTTLITAGLTIVLYLLLILVVLYMIIPNIPRESPTSNFSVLIDIPQIIGYGLIFLITFTLIALAIHLIILKIRAKRKYDHE